MDANTLINVPIRHGTRIVIPTEQLNYVQDMCEDTNAEY